MKVSLPIDSILDDFGAIFKKNRAVVLSAAPGAGKTTRIPVEVAKHTEKQVWVLEPRRIAAISAAHRIAEENQWTVGREVGYQVRFDNKSSNATRILFLTEALLLKKMIQDPDLQAVECVILDEFHERSIHVDLALAALKELQELSRPDLKIVVMSATLNAEPLAQYLNHAPVVESAGKIYPLQTEYQDKPQLLQVGADFIDRMRKLVNKAASENPDSDILVFLPGRGEIERLSTALESQRPNSTVIVALHGQLQLQEQKRAILPAENQRKIILSTNIAESSLTVEGVRCVVDSGLVRLQKQDVRTGFESLQLARISKASAVQRAGRAARLGPGAVYRAWTPHDERSMPAFEKAEVERVDLSETLLLLAALGVRDAESFSWFERPPTRALEMATQQLKVLGAIAEDGRLTALGRLMQTLPVSPRIAKLLIEGEKMNLAHFACELGGLLSEARPAKGNSNSGRENDVMVLWEAWKNGEFKNKMADRAIEQLKSLVGTSKAPESVSDENVDELLLKVYADRLCRRRQARSVEAKMVGGRGVKLHADSSVKESEFFLALSVSEGRDAANALVFQAVGIPQKLINEEILPHAQVRLRLEWDEEAGRFWSIESREWNGLSVGLDKRRPAQNSEIQERLVDVAVEKWPRIVENNEELRRWISRLEFLHQQQPDWPTLSDADIRAGLALACFGENSLSVVEKKELVSFFENALSSVHRNELQKQCPSHCTVPTGNRYKIAYGGEQGPQLEVRLQELFGLTQTPEVAGQPLTLVLLAPNFRPVQVTRDIVSFWKNVYPDVRKELRARYPKHSWPEDPFTALPQAKGRHQNR